MLEDYAEKNGFTCICHFTNDGIPGTTFGREGLQPMLAEVAAPIVRRIFRMTMEGCGPYQIAAQLSDERIPVPACHQAQLGVGLWQNREIKNPYKRGSSTIAHILQKHEYLGNAVNFNMRKHFKGKKSHYVDKDQWIVLEQKSQCEVEVRQADRHGSIAARDNYELIKNTPKCVGVERLCKDIVLWNRTKYLRHIPFRNHMSVTANREQSA